MPRYALKIEYHGAPFVGWQRQTDRASVQGAVEAALAKLEPRDHNIAAAGAPMQACMRWHRWRIATWNAIGTPFRLSEALNYHLKPQPVAIIDCAAVADDLHARFSALRTALSVPHPDAAAHLPHIRPGWSGRSSMSSIWKRCRRSRPACCGKHDFTTFRSTICQADSPVKTLDHLACRGSKHLGGPEVHFDVRARSFLHNQVRSFRGYAGTGRHRVVVASRMCDQRLMPVTAPPAARFARRRGCICAHVTYPARSVRAKARFQSP